MEERTLQRALLNIPLGGLRYFEQTGSTNDAALAWAATGRGWLSSALNKLGSAFSTTKVVCLRTSVGWAAREGGAILGRPVVSIPVES